MPCEKVSGFFLKDALSGVTQLQKRVSREAAELRMRVWAETIDKKLLVSDRCHSVSGIIESDVNS